MAAAAPAPAANLMIGKRAVIVLPSSTRNASMTPALGAATSIVVLSVSILAKISSALTESPTFLTKLMSTSLIESANSGDSIVIDSSILNE